MMSSMNELSDDGGELPLAESEVTRCCFDYGTSLLFLRDHEDYELRLQTSFSLVTSTGIHQIEPEDLSTVAVMLRVIRLEVAHAACSGEGALSISFTDGTAIHVEPDPRYEAWTFNGPNGLLIVALPGGGLAIWDERDTRS